MSLFAGYDIACRRGERLVFRGLSFALEAGAALVLTGANGSGKSSLLRLMAGLLPPHTGSLRWAGEPIAGDPAAHRARLHLIGHQDALKPVLTVLENAAFWAGLRGAASAAAASALERLGLSHLADAPCRLLSAGQKKRLSLARLLASSAPLWLLDEPTTGLDEAATRNLGDKSARPLGDPLSTSTRPSCALRDSRPSCAASAAAPRQAGSSPRTAR